jgi:uncharacterized protein with FMN-binding domain
MTKRIIYKDGKYKGDSVDALYGQVQVEVVVEQGKIKDINALAYPNSNSISLGKSIQVITELKREAIRSQSSEVDSVSEATETSEGFKKSLESALSKAKYNLKLI